MQPLKDLIDLAQPVCDCVGFFVWKIHMYVKVSTIKRIIFSSLCRDDDVFKSVSTRAPGSRATYHLTDFGETLPV